MNYAFEEFEDLENPSVIFRGIVGSRAYGTANAQSDTDTRGIFVVPSMEYVRLVPPPKQVSDARNDHTYYSLLRFCELMAEANPTTMEMLYLPEDCTTTADSSHSFARWRTVSSTRSPLRTTMRPCCAMRCKIVRTTVPSASRNCAMRCAPDSACVGRWSASGGQTGVDQGALEAALGLGLVWGGWVPKGWRAENGTVPERFRARMQETASANYTRRFSMPVHGGIGTVVAQ